MLNFLRLKVVPVEVDERHVGHKVVEYELEREAERVEDLFGIGVVSHEIGPLVSIDKKEVRFSSLCLHPNILLLFQLLLKSILTSCEKWSSLIT